MQRLAYTLTILLALTLALPARAAVTISELISWDTADGGVGAFKITAHTIEDERAWITFSGSGKTQLVRVDGLDGTQVRTQLISAAQWSSMGGGTVLNGTYGMGIVGDDVQFASTATPDQLWRVDKNTGAGYVYVDNATILAALGAFVFQVGDANGIQPSTGNHAFYDQVSDTILLATGSNQVQVRVTASELTNAFGNSQVSSGMAYDSNGNLYWGNYLSDALCRRSATGALEIILGPDDFVPVTGTNDASFGDIQMLPDGWFYFMERRSGSILRFNPDAPDPAATLETYITEGELTNSVCGTENLGCFSSYHGYLTWNNTNNDTGTNGVYIAVPEPAAALALAIAAVVRARGTGFRKKSVTVNR
jgi:hypothetical protein